VIERNHPRSGPIRIALTAILTLGVASARSSADIPIASDSYVTGSDPTQGQYIPFNSATGTPSLFTGQPSNLTNTGFVNGGYVHGSGTNNFVASSTGLDSAVDGASSTGSGSVAWIPAPLDGSTRSVARNLSTFNEGTTGTYWTSMLVSELGNQTTTSGWVLSGFGGSVAPILSTPTMNTSGNLTGIFLGFADDTGTAKEADLVLRYRNTTGMTSADQVLLNGANNALAGQTFLVVAQININVSGPNNSHDQVNYWVNPTSLASLSDLNATSLTSGTIDTLAFQGAATGNGDFTRLNYDSLNWDGAATFDEARLGTTLASIAPAAVPEPSGLVLTALGGGLIVVGTLRRRRRAGR
jgi:hypothetical protein